MPVHFRQLICIYSLGAAIQGDYIFTGDMWKRQELKVFEKNLIQSEKARG